MIQAALQLCQEAVLSRKSSADKADQRGQPFTSLCKPQGQAQLPKRMTFRPSSIHSRTHKLLTAAMDRRHGLKNVKVQVRTCMGSGSCVAIT